MEVPVSAGLGGLLLLAIGLGLGICGLGMIWYSARLKRMAVARRVDFVRGKSTASHLHPGATATSFTRTPQHNGSGAELEAAVGLFARIGVPAVHAQQALLASRFIAIGVVAIVAFLVAGHIGILSSSPALHLMFSFGAGLAGWFIPQLVIGHEINSRANTIVTGLPDALELLVICVEAGLSLEDGIDRIVGELKVAQPALAQELALTSADLKILPTRELALNNLAERVNRPSVRSVVTTLSQTMRYGTPLAQALRSVASELRNDSLMRMEERANQLPSLMTVPMMIFIMPTIFLIVGGPAALRVMDAFHH